MKSIKTLVKDIYDIFDKEISVPAEAADAFGKSLAAKLVQRLSGNRQGATLRLSNLGTPCRRKLWYMVRCPELGEKLSAPTRIKFLFGDILEELLLFLARVAGHTVTDEQKEVEIAGVKGHIDGLVDGELVDCKSASSYSFDKFKSHTLSQDDPFGYLTQLSSYKHALDGSGNRAHFLAIDKQHGHIALDTHEFRVRDFSSEIEETRRDLESPEPPARGFTDRPDGASGNRSLGTVCGYCAFKHQCWPGLRVFNYAGKPKFLTVVEREPRVPEIK